MVVAEYRVGDAGHARLRGYKDAPTAAARDLHRRAVTRELADWLGGAGGAVLDRLGPWAVVTPVPSTRRPGPPPAGRLLDEVPNLAARHLRSAGAGEGRGRTTCVACRDSFAPLPGIDRAFLGGLPVLVFDDSVTTGAGGRSRRPPPSAWPGRRRGRAGGGPGGPGTVMHSQIASWALATGRRTDILACAST